MIIDVYSGANGSHPDPWWRSSIRDGPGHARLGQNPPHRCLHLLGELALGRGVTASRRHAGHLIQEDCWEVPTQEPWKIRIGGLVVGDGMIYSFLRGQSYWIPIAGLFFDVFWGFKLNKLQCVGIISPRMDEVLESVASVDFESFPPIATLPH